MPANVIFDLDDWCDDANELNVLYRMKAYWPDFKVTMFTIPMKCSPGFLREVSKIDWIQMAVHGWEHTPCEFENMGHADTRTYLKIAYDMGGFVKGFKAPMWRLSQGTVDAIKEMGWWLANNADPASNPNGVVVHPDVHQYFFNGNDIHAGVSSGNWCREHGHVNCLSCANDIRQIYHYMLKKYPEHDTKFHFIDDVIKEQYGEGTAS